jgi:hypothetical protein
VKVLLDLPPIRLVDFDRPDRVLRVEGDQGALGDLTDTEVCRLVIALKAWLGDGAVTTEIEDRTAGRIAAWIEDNPPGDGMRAGSLLADEIRDGAWRE